jgi:hypothetical protein
MVPLRPRRRPATPRRLLLQRLTSAARQLHAAGVASVVVPLQSRVLSTRRRPQRQRWWRRCRRSRVRRRGARGAASVAQQWPPHQHLLRRRRLCPPAQAVAPATLWPLWRRRRWHLHRPHRHQLPHPRAAAVARQQQPSQSQWLHLSPHLHLQQQGAPSGGPRASRQQPRRRHQSPSLHQSVHEAPRQRLLQLLCRSPQRQSLQRPCPHVRHARVRRLRQRWQQCRRRARRQLPTSRREARGVQQQQQRQCRRQQRLGQWQSQSAPSVGVRRQRRMSPRPLRPSRAPRAASTERAGTAQVTAGS